LYIKTEVKTIDIDNKIIFFFFFDSGCLSTSVESLKYHDAEPKTRNLAYK
jgi:hypothetical protein